MSENLRTPILVGVGQVVEAIPEDLNTASSPQDLAAKAAISAMNDALSAHELATEIDVIAAVRTFSDSSPMWPCPFGGTNNMPRSIARRIGADPASAVYSTVSGTVPQTLVNEYMEKLATGEARMVLLAGGESIANTKAALRAGAKLDWNEEIDGQLDNRGTGLASMFAQVEAIHRAVGAPSSYALLENARRASRGESIEEYAAGIGRLFEPFSRVAASNPYSMFSDESMTAEEIVREGERNRMISFPYTRAMVAKDGVNQASALLLTTVERARELGISEDKWVYLHGYAQTHEKRLLERESLTRSRALALAYTHALDCAGVSIDQVSFIDIYSCFPVAVFSVCDALGLSPDDPRGLTLTGGLPFFGGPGNNYSMHGIAEVVARVRANTGSIGLVGANGGVLAKQAVGIYSCTPKEGGWKACSSKVIQAEVDAVPTTPVDYNPEGPATIESYTVAYSRGKPDFAIVIARLDSTGDRFIANNFDGDADTVMAMLDGDMIGKPIHVMSLGYGNRFAFDEDTLKAFAPPKPTTFRDHYKFCLVERNDRILEVTINRPEVYNCLTPEANAELEEIFDLYMEDDDLWVAILTGAGDAAFCTGNDLKYSAAGKPIWIPKTGFGGLTHRTHRNKPVIAAVNGYAMGGGLEIAMACDQIVAAKNAKFALPEVKVGLFAGAGGVQRITRQIPLKQAMNLLLTGRAIDVDEASEMGLVNIIAENGQVMEQARILARQIAENSPFAVRCTMDLLHESARYSSIDEAVGAQYQAFDTLLSSEDFVEGPKAFSEKRKPVWRNR
jgi:acetyl-CoA C-acetyltransferase